MNSAERRRLLDESVLESLPTLRGAGAVRLDWRSPLQIPLFESDRPFHEYRDGKVFDAVGRRDLRANWRTYWPARSQVWDAIAVAYAADDEWLGPVLVEAKSYPGEFWPTTGGSAAGERSLGRIRRRLRETRNWLRIAEAPSVVEQWEGRLYQSANRLATLRFFRDPQVLGEPVDAWLLNLYFVNDETHTNGSLATSKHDWESQLAQAEEALGLRGKKVPHSGRVFLEAGSYDDLVAATGG